MPGPVGFLDCLPGYYGQSALGVQLHGFPGPVLSFELPVVSVPPGRLVLDRDLQQALLQPGHRLVGLVHQVLEVPVVLQPAACVFRSTLPPSCRI
jgi:hypothetical protein